MATLKNWEDTYKYWLALSVPDIEFITFDREKHNPYFEWYDKEEKDQLHYHDNPIKQTAFHLANYLKDREGELIAAYKIFSILKYFNLYEYNNKIEPAFSKYHEELYGWWSPNSKYLFPYFEGINDFELSRRSHQSADWKTIINTAAKFWTEIANHLSIVIIPELMNHDSAEYKAFSDFEKSIEDQREYQQYLRLKEKFEKE